MIVIDTLDDLRREVDRLAKDRVQSVAVILGDRDACKIGAAWPLTEITVNPHGLVNGPRLQDLWSVVSWDMNDLCTRTGLSPGIVAEKHGILRMMELVLPDGRISNSFAKLIQAEIFGTFMEDGGWRGLG